MIKRGQVIEVEIVEAAFGGNGIAKIPTEKGDYILFVPNTIVGQLVRARVVKRKNNYAECKLDTVLKKSHLEDELPYQPISGAPFATLPIEIQKSSKQKQVLEVFKRIGKINNIETLFDEYIASPEVWHYRNKMEYSFSAIGFDVEKQEEFDGFALGFKKRGTWWIVENLEKDSGIFDAAFENNLKEIRVFCQNSGLPAWHPPKKVGFFRYLVVRKSYLTNKFLIKLVTSSDGLANFDFDGFVNLINALFPDRIIGILHTVNDDIGDNSQSRLGHETILYGQPYMLENLVRLNFEVSMQSFFQTNPKAAELLYKKVIEYVLEDNKNIKEKTVMDLFCGTGTIGQIVASQTNATVIGVDIVEDAIINAKQNAERNNVENVQFFAADVNKFLYEYPEYVNKIGTLILDPPRAGIAKKALLRALELNADRIVYVSCNPATQARDILEITAAGYQLKKVSLVDQFPHTAHIESVALFLK
ncbi:MAG: 23S rRNA (uracil(1939)-C(5))-methyltransferase RlmD [Flavobacteriales bacterium CG18_big_fil_WC_8_21_14_2_50_32_9]|nr:MAG: 23S rRNA (uracil(1939)-C(5))-methyltransferase RlmD [Flavobacteriales bacterium CG18_big_fil_WC_8_21_14_2_50_32_9]PJC62672.1 MAG: 23S rRNA (uracil(1939)-C(5))-methyltransferase RlmD [Flavobacteriales bacterium CG_4_9_14_0_2_um_filter_32_27]